MKAAIPIDSPPNAALHLPFANEMELQGFVEEYAENILIMRALNAPGTAQLTEPLAVASGC